METTKLREKHRSYMKDKSHAIQFQTYSRLVHLDVYTKEQKGYSITLWLMPLQCRDHAYIMAYWHHTTFIKWHDTVQVQSNTEVYSSFAIKY